MDVKPLFLFLFFMPCFLIGCASSDVSRSSADQVDGAYENSASFLNNMGRDNPADAYQNSTQTAKGVLLGGATGAIAGGLTTGVGAFPGAAGGAVFGGIIGAYIDHQTNLLDQLENRGVRVIVLGDQIMVVLPSAQIFKNATPSIKFQANSTLDLVAKLINSYTTMSIKVAAYTNDSSLPPAINRALSQQQANNVMRYLWPRVNTRLLSAAGYGGCHLVQRNNLVWDQGDNYRVEITLEKLPV
jgi:outer membrane protein OmpA-like peptidoglycan-associated protein